VRGHKAAISNPCKSREFETSAGNNLLTSMPDVSDQAKEYSRQILENQYGESAEKTSKSSNEMRQEKDPANV